MNDEFVDGNCEHWNVVIQFAGGLEDDNFLFSSKKDAQNFALSASKAANIHKITITDDDGQQEQVINVKNF